MKAARLGLALSGGGFRVAPLLLRVGKLSRLPKRDGQRP